jgi:hypothetical protein
MDQSKREIRILLAYTERPDLEIEGISTLVEDALKPLVDSGDVKIVDIIDYPQGMVDYSQALEPIAL